MMNRAVIAVTFLVVAAAAVEAQEMTKPIRYTWIVTSCENWNCAAAALVLADGDKHTIILPTGREERPWLVLRRVEEGAIELPEDEPFTCDVYQTVTEATSGYTAMDACHGPILLSVPDGRSVVMSLSQCDSGTGKRRVAAK